LTRRDQALWLAPILLAIALCLSGTHAKNVAELHHTEAGLYRLMPGIVLGLLAGFLFDSPTVVLAVTIATNAAVYHVSLRGLVRLCAKVNARSETGD